MTDTIFTLDLDRLATWEPPNKDLAEPTWDPTDLGNESSIIDLVYDAQQAGVIGTLFNAGWDATIEYTYCDDSDGGGFLWTLDLEAPNLEDYNGLRLASAWRTQRTIVRDEATGRDAMLQILSEAVETGNALYAHLLRWFPFSVPHVFHNALGSAADVAPA